MEHERTFDGQIHASIAKRIGVILEQYKGDYEVTLCLSLLQTLLTQFTESKDSKKSTNFEKWLNQEWTLGTVVQSEPQDSLLQYKNVLESLRHALSHPCDQKDTPYPATGYSEYWADPSGELREIQAFKFTHSPDVKDDGSGLRKKTNPRFRVLILKLTTDQLRTLTLELSRHLSSSLLSPEAHDRYPRECELEADLAQSRADMAAGRMVAESASAHMARLEDMSPHPALNPQTPPANAPSLR